jgi:3alpha(or 20beta)-hydroxysteroid dehydrogenase
VEKQPVEGRRFTGRVVLVTGGAGGIGRAAVERFLAEGASVVAVDLEGPRFDALRHEVSGPLHALVADVTRGEEVRRAVAEAAGRFGGIDALFNNAGIEGEVAPFEQYPDETFDRVLAVNVRGVFLGIKHVVPELRRRGGGVIVNTASVAGLVGEPSIAAYVASKHAVLGLTKSAAIAFGPENIRVNAVCPAPIETRMMRALESGLAPHDPQGVQKMLVERIPQGRYGTPEEVAAVVAFLCSDDARYVNGGIYTVDGGMTAR